MIAGYILPRVAGLVAALLTGAALGAAPAGAADLHLHTPRAHHGADAHHGHHAPMSPVPKVLAQGTDTTQAQAGQAEDVAGMHGHGHDRLHHWYETLKQPGTGMSCCNDEDCRPTLSRTVGEQVQVLVDGEWATVPASKILKTPSPDLGSHVCAPKQANLFPKGFVYCAVIGSGV